MDKHYGNTRFWTTFVKDRNDGFAGLRLHQERSGSASVAAEVILR